MIDKDEDADVDIAIDEDGGGCRDSDGQTRLRSEGLFDIDESSPAFQEYRLKVIQTAQSLANELPRLDQHLSYSALSQIECYLKRAHPGNKLDVSFRVVFDAGKAKFKMTAFLKNVETREKIRK